MLQVIEERERLQAEFKKKSELEKEELKSNWIEKIDNTDQVRGRLFKNIYVELFSELLSGEGHGTFHMGTVGKIHGYHSRVYLQQDS